MQQQYDWRTFQEFLSMGGRSVATEANSPVFLVEREGRVVATYSPGEDLGEWLGTDAREAAAHFKHRECHVVGHRNLSDWLTSSLEGEHVVEQAEKLRASVAAAAHGAVPVVTGGTRPMACKHFLLDGIQGWWAKVLPSSYGIYIRLDRPRAGGGEERREFCFVVRRGRFERFHAPDLSGLGRERARSDADTVKYLSERYLVPFQGIVLQEKDWEDWSRLAEPWRLVLLALRSRRAKLVPFRWSLGWLVAVRAFFGI